MIIRVANLYGKPSERLILQACCQRYDCNFRYNEEAGYATIEGDNAVGARNLYRDTLNVAYKRLGLAQASNKLSEVPNKTLVSEFMEAYSAIACSVITGNAFSFLANTEAKRAGLKAASEADN